MIRSYLGYIETIDMISRRLTETQKAQILDAYRTGDNTNLIAKNYNCPPNTIIRTVKNLLPEAEYTLLKKNRVKISNKNQKFVNSQNVKEQKQDLEKTDSLISFEEKVKKENLSVKANEESYESKFDEMASIALEDSDNLCEGLHSEDIKNNNLKIDEENQNFDNNFQQIAPLISSFDFDQKKQKSDFEILNYESLPESVYMIVDKKVELDLQPISDLPEWSFLPENELQRNAILLFTNQRTAKTLCSRNQRVIKIPNTSIFELSKSYLISKGITRLILEDSIIGLDD